MTPEQIVQKLAERIADRLMTIGDGKGQLCDRLLLVRDKPGDKTYRDFTSYGGNCRASVVNAVADETRSFVAEYMVEVVLGKWATHAK